MESEGEGMMEGVNYDCEAATVWQLAYMPAVDALRVLRHVRPEWQKTCPDCGRDARPISTRCYRHCQLLQWAWEYGMLTQKIVAPTPKYI
jgi:hypothetical protein